MKLEIKRLKEEASLPFYASAGAAGLDLAACLSAPMTLEPGAQALVPTGISIALPQGTVGLLHVRSSLGVRRGIALSNGVGVIDEDYRGELHVGLLNLSTELFVIEHGMRLAQLVITPYIRPELVEVDTLPETQRGSGGFGSTGQ